MKKIKVLILVTIFFNINVVLTALPSERAVALLDRGVSGKIEGLGGAGVGVNGIEDSSYNPSGIAEIKFRQIKGGYRTGIGEIKNYFGNLVYPIKNGNNGVVSVNFQYWSLFEGLMIYDETGVVTGESLDGSNLFLIAGYGYSIKKSKINLGVNVKYITEKLYEKYSGFALDGGIQYLISRQVVLGVLVGNIGGEIGGDKVPFNIAGGISYIKEFMQKSVVRNLLFSGQIRYYRDDGELYYSGGIEVGFKKIRVQETFASTYIRLGISSKGEETGLSVGAGFEWKQIGIDYVLNPKTEINEYYHTISMSYRFEVNENKVGIIKDEIKKKVEKIKTKDNNKKEEKVGEKKKKVEESEEEEF